MMKRFYFICSLLAATILYCCSKDITEEPKVGSIAGSVTDSTTGEPVATVNVSIDPSGSSTVTGSDGSFSFVNLEPGYYKLSIHKEGYNSSSISVTVKAGESISAHMTIDRIPAKLTADKELLDFGEKLTMLSFAIVHSGYTNLEYNVETGDNVWLSVNPSNGVLGYGKTVTIVVSLDRSKLPNGHNEANIVVRSTNGEGSTKVRVTAINNAAASVNTLDVTDVASTTATLHGEILNAGFPAYTERGFVYDMQSTPITTACIQKLSSSVTSEAKYTCNIDRLLPAQTYYARAYIVQGGTTIYGNIISFTTAQQSTMLSTSAVTQIGFSTATFNASILNTGTPAYSERGFCYSKDNSPSIADNRIPVSGSGSGDFSLQVTNLEYPATYYVRAYVIQSGTPIYGNIVTFTTQSTPVSINTYAATEITSSSALLNGSIAQTGIPAYSEKGFCVSSYPQYTPTIENTKIVVGGTGSGDFSARLNSLNYDQYYYFRAYAIQNGSVEYGNVLNFATSYTQASVITSDVSDIRYTDATLNGSVMAIGDPMITERGFCYTDDTYHFPSVTDKVIKVPGIAAGTFKAEIKNLLEEDKTYYVRAYVIQNGEVIYGERKEFSTYCAPIVATGPPTSISSASVLYWKATFQGAFIDGNPIVIEDGFVYSTTANPTVNTGTVVRATKTEYISQNQIYKFTRIISTLSPNCTYYYRAYVKTDFEYIYGSTESFTTY